MPPVHSSEAIRVAVAGATGYTGAELTAILARHRQASFAGLYSGPKGDGVPFERIHPALRGSKGPDVRPLDAKAVDALDADVVFLATPNETSAEITPALVDKGLRVIDLSGAYRLADGAAYPHWYGFDHPAPALLGGAVYGLTEWCNGELRDASLVANPGCYPTAVLLGLKPIASLLDPKQTIVCDAKSGVSGAGKKSDLAYSFAELDGNLKPYGIGKHRHEPEIRAQLGLAEDAGFIFAPHLLPVTRGILTSCYVNFASPADEAALSDCFTRAYSDAEFVRTLPAGELPELRNVVGTPNAEIGFKVLDGGWRAMVVTVIDNLLKGAASQAVQNFNRMLGISEREGLR